ncbi:MAG: DUF2079 domain-containing protein [Chloroflexota bacterium]|nr:DUF2079 domain-containing protein [Chloroflexota bacterium]
MNLTLRKRLAIWWNRLYLYPTPESLPRTRSFWIATGLVALFALLFSAFFIVYLTARHDAYLTNAEDLGIMDQAIWNTLHGHVLHQTICNSVGDTNCYDTAGISRFAIHFEPLLFLISLFYAIAPNPKTLLVIQTLVIASGAFPAFWLARLRLRNDWVAVGIALLYLLYPMQQLAVVSDFHAVTLTAALLLFMLYFMYTRRTAWLIVFAILSMACKEEIPIVVAFYGLWSMLFQRRWRSGLTLVLLGIGWTGLALYIAHLYSPTGSSLLSSRYVYLGSGPVPLVIAREVLLHPIDFLKNHVLDHNHLFYLRQLIAPAGYLPLFAPWALLLVLPTLLLNLLSSDHNMYSGLYQYNAEMVPALIFATIEAVVVIIWLVRWALVNLYGVKPEGPASSVSTSPAGIHASRPVRARSITYWTQLGLLVVLLGYVVLSVARADDARGIMPYTQGFQWPQTSAHTGLAQRFVDMIPEAASVSAQSSLVPHISHRLNVYLFPYGDDRADYIFLDVTSDLYPLFPFSYKTEVNKILLEGTYGVAVAQDGYLLLKHGLTASGLSSYSPAQAGEYALPNLPASFCSFMQASSQEVVHPLQATFSSHDATPSALDLVGYDAVAPSSMDASGGYVQVTTYWRVRTPTPPSLEEVLLVTDSSGREHFIGSDSVGMAWCPTNTWQPGGIFRIKSTVYKVAHLPIGLVHVSVALVPLMVPYSTIMNVQDRLTLHIVRAPGNVTTTQATNALQLIPITVVR